MEQNLPILSEHEAVNKGDTSGTMPGYDPNPEEKADIKLVNSLYDKAKKYKKQYDHNWLDDYKMFRGKQWKEQRPSYRHSEVINMVFSSIQATVPIQLDARPRIEFLPQNPQNTELAEILNHVIESDWIKHNWMMELAEMTYDSTFYGTGLMSCTFDPDADYGVGAIQIQSEDPFYCFPDPRAKNVNTKARYFIHAEPEEIDVLKSKYPDLAKYFKPDLQDLLQGNKQDLDQIRFKSPTDTKTIMEGSSSYETGDVQKCLKITCYMKSDEYLEESYDGVNKDSGLPERLFRQKLKYPNGRKIVIAGGVRCESGPIPYDDGLFPYAKYVNYILPREFWGMSEIEQLKGPQKIFNKLLSFALDIYTLMGNPIWVVDSTAGVDTDNLFNRPGLVVEKEPGTEVIRQSGLDVSPNLLSLVDRLRSWFNETSGSSDISKTIAQNNIESGVAIRELQDVLQTRIRQKSRNMDCFLQDLGALYLSRVFQFYSSPRIIRITKNEHATQYFQFHVETEVDEQGNARLNDAGDPVRHAHVTPYEQHPETGQPVIAGQGKNFLIEAGFDVRVNTGSSLPFAKAEKTSLAVTLFKLNAIDRTELLKSVEYPNWEAVSARMEQLDQQKMAQAQQMQAAKAGGH